MAGEAGQLVEGPAADAERIAGVAEGGEAVDPQPVERAAPAGAGGEEGEDETGVHVLVGDLVVVAAGTGQADHVPVAVEQRPPGRDADPEHVGEPVLEELGPAVVGGPETAEEPVGVAGPASEPEPAPDPVPVAVGVGLSPGGDLTGADDVGAGAEHRVHRIVAEVGGGDGVGHHPGHQRPAGRAVGPGHLDDDLDGGDGIGFEAADGVGEEGGEQAGRPQRGDGVVGHVALLLRPRRPGLDDPGQRSGHGHEVAGASGAVELGHTGHPNKASTYCQLCRAVW